jgi:hypothetical protein
MKKILFTTTLSAVIMIAVVSCQKSQDAVPQNSISAGNSENAINHSITLGYLDSGTCAMVHGLPSSQGTNYNGYPSFQATVWTYLGTPAPRRSLMRFGFQNLPSSCTPATLVSAKLYLYQQDETNTTGNYYSLAQVTNDAEIRRVKTSWSASTVTWLNQPLTTGLANGISKNTVAITDIPTPFTGSQDNQVIDVTEMVKSILPGGTYPNYGFEIRFPNGRETQFYKGRTYGSFTSANVAVRPVLKLYWQ